jgi:hypothetical protein
MEKARASCAKAEKAWDVSHAAWEKDRPSMDGIHWREFSFRDRCEVARVIDVEKEWKQFLESQGKLWGASDPEATKARRRAAYDSVLEFRRREAEHDERHGYSAANDRLDAAANAYSDTTSKLLEMPAPDGEALLWKLDYLFGDTVEGDYSPGWSASIMQTVMTDAQRLLSAGRA